MRKRIIVMSAILALACVGNGSGADEIKVGGGGASIATIFKAIEIPFEKASGISLITLQSTPQNGLMDLANGSLDLATGAVPLEAMLKGAEKDGVKIDPMTLEKTVVGKNRTVLLVHPSNPVQSLSKQQIKGIFTGKIVNWKEVGGSDAVILVAWGKLSPGQNAQFTKELLDGEPVTKDALETTDYFGIKDTVAATPEAVGIDPLALGADKTVKVIKTDPPMLSDIIVLTKGKPSPKVQKLLRFIAEQGDRYIAR
jgi:phosphate transport system substrate-binding protein